jgi:NhaP-type Na+/H+ or K+/H+ antiporter
MLLGAGLTLVLAVGCQVLASRLRIPAIIVLLPVGFAAGALTSDVNPERLLGRMFQTLVSLAVAAILYNAGLRVHLNRLTNHSRQIVGRLIIIGAPVTLVLGAVAAYLFLGMSRGAAVLTGAILVASGTSVVRPLLAYVRPAERLRHVLAWEGALLAPVGGLLAVVVSYAVLAGADTRGLAAQVGQFALSIAVGLAGGLVGTAVLWVALRKARLARSLLASVQFAVVIGVAAGCDALRDNTGLLAAVTMGLTLANLPGFRVPARRFLETQLDLVLGVLLLSIAATVSVASLEDLVLPVLAVVAVLVLVGRPLAALAATHGTDLTRRERFFIGWMAPRGVVAAAMAAAFAGPLAPRSIPGAAKILPVTLLVVVLTVAFYALSAVPASQRLGVLRAPRSRPLLVGGEDWVIDLGRTLQTVGLDVLMWAGLEPQRERIRQAALELAPEGLLASVTAERTEVSGVTTVLLLTPEDDFNALAAGMLRYTIGNWVYRLAPPADGRGVIAPFTGGNVLFGRGLNRSTMTCRYEDGARIVALPAGCPQPAGQELLFVVRADGLLDPATQQRAPAPHQGDTIIVLSTAGD